MSLSSALFTGTSGLKNMGNGMQVVGNNIANTNTVGFKGAASTFADTLYENVATQAGTAQMGRGMSVGDIATDFSQGSFESTGNTTDLSIGGDGFFIVSQPDSEEKYYTRAGNFYFDEDGQLVNPEGYVVQGWELDEDTGEDVGAIGDLVLEEFTSPPKESTTVTAITNLDADAISQAVVLSNVWDSSEDEYMGSGNYEYQTVIQVYDSLGSTHDVTIYYDKISGTEWEYIITCNPEEDMRNLVQGTDAQGLLARGSITFSESSGDILDLTLEEFTGRIGNFTANGLNTVGEIEYNIVDYDALSLDGYGFQFEYDGANWGFADIDGDGVVTSADKPANYPNAYIIYSDATSVEISFDGSTDEPDLKIELSQPAVATDSFGFDINGEESIHIQGIEGLTYTGDTANDNTSLSINDPGVMTHDTEDVGIVWNPVAQQWYWSNPEQAEDEGTLLSDATLGGVDQDETTFLSIKNASEMVMLADDVTLAVDYRTGEWDWNMPLKADDFINETFNIGQGNNNPSVTVVTQGTQGAIASTDAGGTSTAVTLTWDGAAWAASSGGGQTQIVILTSSSDDSTVQFMIWEADGSTTPSNGASVVKYSFNTPLTTTGGDTIEFTIDPSPPAEYPNAVLTTSGATTLGIGIDLDNDSSVDLQMITSASGAVTVLSGGLTATFDIDPDTEPPNYSNATLTGDQTEVIIDLDGSGNEGDDDDIVFTFEKNLDYGANTDVYDNRSVINFDILGSTAWTAIEKAGITNTGYYSFTVDFLGGDYGTTEMNLALDFGTQFDGENFVNDSLSTTQYAKSSSTVYQDADGYAAGDLTGVDVNSEGVITGIYSNGQLIPLFRVGLAKFYNNYGLSNEGGNLYSETNESGNAITNKPGENGLGTISPNSLEMSNVDISDEFVAMIEIQRGYEGNSKTITTVDEMMETVINMKR